MKLNVRTLLILVIGITTISVVYQTILAQLGCIGITLLLLFALHPTPQQQQRILHRLTSLGRIIFTVMVFQILFRRDGAVLWQWHSIVITDIGIQYGVASSLRFFLIILVAGMLFDIPYYRYLQAFHAWKLPNEISFLAATTIHFIPIFRGQFMQSIEALTVRGIALRELPLRKRPKVYTSLLFPVLAKAISDVKYRAMSLELRGFRLYPTRTLLHKAPLTPLDIALQIITVVTVITILVA